HRRRDAKDGIDIGPRGGLHKLPRVGVERFEIAALTFGEQNVEGERALAAARYAGDHGEAPARNPDIDVLEIVLACVVDVDELALFMENVGGNFEVALRAGAVS